VWILVLCAAATVVIEGSLLSWGGSSSTSDSATTTTIRSSQGPRICPNNPRNRFIQIEYLRYGGGDQPAVVTGKVLTVHCGGPDDFQFIVHAKSENVSLRANVKVTLLTLEPTYYLATLKECSNYLAYDEDGNIFLVVGPNSRATALTAEFHP
jgi:hypothetical protein